MAFDQASNVIEFVASSTRDDIENFHHSDEEEAMEAVPGESLRCSRAKLPSLQTAVDGVEIIAPDGSFTEQRPQTDFLLSVDELTKTVQVTVFEWAPTIRCAATAGAGNPCATSSATCGQAFCCCLCCLLWPRLQRRWPRLCGWLVYLWSMVRVLCFEMDEWRIFLDEQLEDCRQQRYGRTRHGSVRVAMHIDSMLRGIAQVVFVNNPFGGAVIVATMIAVNAWVGFLALLSAFSATLAAEVFGLDWTLFRQGLFTYNGYLIGAGLGTFLQPVDVAQPFHSWPIVLLTLLGGAFSTIVHVAISAAVSPCFTLSFASINTLFFLGARQYTAFTDIADIAPSFPLDTSTAPALHLSADFLYRSLFCGVSQIYFMSSAPAGIVLACVTTICNPLLTVATLLGAALGVLLACLLGATPDDIRTGLWGFNPALAFMAMFTLLRPSVLRSYVVAVFISTLAFFFYAGLRSFLQTLGAPASTFGFCLASIVGMALRGRVPGIAQPQSPSVAPPKRHS